MNFLQAIIFDVDGTLADTEDCHRQAFNRAFKDFGLDWDWTPKLYEELLVISGGRERITFFGADLARDFAHADEFADFVRRLHSAKTEIYASMLRAGEVRLRPGVARLLDEAREAGLRLGVATSSAYSNLQTLLDQNLEADWPRRFTAIATSDSVEPKKPSPAVYRAVLAGLKIAPEACVAIEDTENGLQAATAAGVATVVTTHYFTRHHHFPNAALVVDSLGEAKWPPRVLSGDLRGHDYVDLALLDRLLTERDVAARSATRDGPRQFAYA